MAACNWSRPATLVGRDQLGAQTALKVEPDPQNVVASRLIGRWQLDLELSRRLGGDLRIAAVLFQQDDAVVAKVPARFIAKLQDFKIALAGVMTLQGKQHPVVLIQMNGNPHVVYYRERDGDPLGDAESCNVMLARGDKPETDLSAFSGALSVPATGLAVRNAPSVITCPSRAAGRPSSRKAMRSRCRSARPNLRRRPAGRATAAPRRSTNRARRVAQSG
jgi:hypothetical protein